MLTIILTMLNYQLSAHINHTADSRCFHQFGSDIYWKGVIYIIIKSVATIVNHALKGGQKCHPIKI